MLPVFNTSDLNLDRETLLTSSRIPWHREDILEVLGMESDVPFAKELGHNQICHRIERTIGAIMPEEHPGQHHEIAARLYGLRQGTGVTDALMWELFLLANNFKSCEFECIARVLRSCRLDCDSTLRRLVAEKDPTHMSIAEKIFGSVLRAQDVRVLRIMLEAGIDPDMLVDIYDGKPSETRRDLMRPLVYAASLRDSKKALEISQLLLRFGASVNLCKNWYSALWNAVSNKHQSLVTILIAAGAHCSPSTLTKAISEQSDDIVQALLDGGADVNAADTWGNTPISEAIDTGNIQLMRTLISHGAGINRQQRVWTTESTNALGLAASRGKHEMVQLLLEAGADVNPPSCLCTCPLVYAIHHVKIAETLVGAHANIAKADAALRKGERDSLLYSLIKDGTEDESIAALSRVLIAGGARITSPALYLAIRKGLADIVGIFLAKSNSVFDKVLEIAIESGHVEIARIVYGLGYTEVATLHEIPTAEMMDWLELAGLMPDIITRFGVDIFTTAIGPIHSDVIERLSSCEIDFRTSSSSRLAYSPLEVALFYGRHDLVRFLIERGAVVTTHILAAAAAKPLHEQDERLEIFKYIFSLWQETSTEIRNLEGTESTPVAVAVIEQNPEVLELLLDYGLDPRGVLGRFPGLPYSGMIKGTIPQMAVRFGDSAIFGDFILDAVLNAATWSAKDLGRALTEAVHCKNYDLARYLLGAGADPNMAVTIKSNRAAITPLVVAVGNGEASLVQKLVEAGANVNKLGSGPFARTPLQCAVESKLPDLVDLLLKAGADVNASGATVGGATALQLAAIRGHLSIARTLLDKRADVNAPAAPECGRTAIEGAAEHGRDNMLHLLLSRGGRIEGRERAQYIRAVKLAEAQGHYGTGQLLKSYSVWTEPDSACFNDMDVDEISPVRQPFGFWDAYSAGECSDTDDGGQDECCEDEPSSERDQEEAHSNPSLERAEAGSEAEDIDWTSFLKEDYY